MVPVLEAVPNFSDGRDLGWIKELVQVIAAEGPEVIDWTADRDHHRSVVTYIGDPESVEAASIAAARFAIEGIDLRTHEGVHPRIGALDVLPFVPLHDLTMDSAVESAWRVGGRLAEEGVPVFFYGEALRGRSPPRSDCSLASIRRGGLRSSPKPLSGRPGAGPARSPVAGQTTSHSGRDLRRGTWGHAGVERLCGGSVLGRPPVDRRRAP